MINRYTRPEMAAIWTQESRFETLLKVEVAVAEVQEQLGIIPEGASYAIRTKAKINVQEIEKIEMTTKHDVIAFVTQVAQSVGPEGKYIHFAMTSSDVLDTALSIQIKSAGQVLSQSIGRLELALSQSAEKYQKTLCAGRTHGMHAEPTSFGAKLAGFLMELRRNRFRFQRALDQMAIGKISGAVGTFSAQPPEVESQVCARLGLRVEPVSTQVIPRDRHAELIWSLTMLGTGLERLAVELRHLQRTEVSEVIEGFSVGQKGSSAMPHKKNPISAENITGASRVLRGYLLTAMENISLWHERDISHSSAERVIFPDAFILTDYVVDRMAKLIEGLYVDEEKMIRNMELSQGHLMSSHLLLKLVNSGMSREEAYSLVQELALSLKLNEHLYNRCLSEDRITTRISKQELKDLFEGQFCHPEKLVSRAQSSVDGGWLS